MENDGYDGLTLVLTNNMPTLPGVLFRINAIAFSASWVECWPLIIGTPLCQAAPTVGTVVRHAVFFTVVSLKREGSFRRWTRLRYFNALLLPR